MNKFRSQMELLKRTMQKCSRHSRGRYQESSIFIKQRLRDTRLRGYDGHNNIASDYK